LRKRRQLHQLCRLTSLESDAKRDPVPCSILC
jgi:hypothetical protein